MLDYYEIKQKTSSGSTCLIYKAIRLRDGAPAIIKKYMKPQVFLQEVATMNLLSHENIAKYINYGIYMNARYLLMPHYGRSISKLIKSRMFSRDNIKYYMRQLLEALDYMHSKKIIHADLSASNVIISRRTHKLTIIDLGAAHYDRLPNKLRTHILYRAPELSGLNEKVDIWAAGCIFAAMMLRRHLFQCGGPINWELFAGWPKECGLLTKMLDLDPNKRISAKAALSDEYFA